METTAEQLEQQLTTVTHERDRYRTALEQIERMPWHTEKEASDSGFAATALAQVTLCETAEEVERRFINPIVLIDQFIRLKDAEVLLALINRNSSLLEANDPRYEPYLGELEQPVDSTFRVTQFRNWVQSEREYLMGLRNQLHQFPTHE